MDKEEKIPSRCKPEGSRNNGKMITSLLPLMSLLTIARVPALDDMCTGIIRHILQFLDYRSKKMLRGVSSTLKNRVEGCDDKTVHYWRFSTEFTTDQFIKFADEVKTVIGFEVCDGTDDGVAYLVKKHPEILMFKLGRGELGIGNLGSKFTSNGLLQILQFCKLRSLDISVENITGEDLSEHKGILPCLEILKLNCRHLTDRGLLQILKLCGSTLRSLNLLKAEITGSNLSEYKGILPCLEILKLNCRHLTDKGLLQILQLWGSTLISLDIRHTNITGANLSEYKGTLPCLENLRLSNCRQLKKKGLLQILQLCGSTLRSLNLGVIIGEYLSEYTGTLPCLENLNMVFCEHLTDEGLQQILHLCGSTLRSLDISHTNITGESLSQYKGTLPCLENLNMSGCRHLTDKGLLQILQLCGSSLRSLKLFCTEITGENLSEYKGTPPCLENLNMDLCTHLTDKGLLQILHLCGSTLRSLDILHTNITGESLSQYKGTLPCFENLNMMGCRHLTDKGLLQILQLCGSTLRSLDISETNITGENLSEYKGTLPCLENLNMRCCTQLTDKGLLQILQLCGSTLRSLDIEGTKITGENLSEYKGTLPCLENLNIYDCYIKDKGLLQILQLCGSTLRSLDISETNITGENLSEYKGTLPCLENLNMGCCKQLTNKGLLQILQLCGSTLRFLDIVGTNVTGENLSEYKGTLSCLENLKIN